MYNSRVGKTSPSHDLYKWHRSSLRWKIDKLGNLSGHLWSFGCWGSNPLFSVQMIYPYFHPLMTGIQRDLVGVIITWKQVATVSSASETCHLAGANGRSDLELGVPLRFHQNISVIQKVPGFLLFRMKAARFNASLAQLIPLLLVLAAWLLSVGTIFFGVQRVLYQRLFAERFLKKRPVDSTKNRRSGRVLPGLGYAILSHQQKRREFLPSEDPWQHLIVAVWRITLTWTGQAGTGNVDSISCEQSWFCWNLFFVFSSWKGDKSFR